MRSWLILTALLLHVYLGVFDRVKAEAFTEAAESGEDEGADNDDELSRLPVDTPLEQIIYPFVSHHRRSIQYITYNESSENINFTRWRAGGGNRTWHGPSKHSSLFSTGYLRYLTLYLTPVVIVLGIIGNVVSFVVLFKFTQILKFSSDFHLCTLAVFDTGGLIFSTFPFWANTFFRGEMTGQGLPNPLQKAFSFGPCQFWMFTSFEFRYLSHWTIVIFSLERYFIITQPFESVTRFTIKRSALITTCLIVVTCLFNMHIFWMFDKGMAPGGKTFCKWRPQFYISTCVHMVLMTFIPSVIIVVFNCLMIRSLMKHTREGPAVIASSNKERETQVTRRLISVAVTFVILTLPFSAVAYYRNVKMLNHDHDFTTIAAEFYSFTCFFYMTNYACNFILYCVTGTRFRKAVVRLCRCEPIDTDLNSSTSQRRSSSTMCTPNLSRYPSMELRKDVIETVPLNVVLNRLKMKTSPAELYA